MWISSCIKLKMQGEDYHNGGKKWIKTDFTLTLLTISFQTVTLRKYWFSFKASQTNEHNLVTLSEL